MLVTLTDIVTPNLVNMNCKRHLIYLGSVSIIATSSLLASLNPPSNWASNTGLLAIRAFFWAFTVGTGEVGLATQ